MKKQFAIPRLSGFVINYNEKDSMLAALESLRFCAEVVLVDKHSTDGSAEAAQGLADKIIRAPWTPIVEDTRQLALDACGNEWVFFIDADELCSPALAAWMLEFLSDSSRANSADAVRFARINHRFGLFSTRQRDWPQKQIRLVRREAVRMPPEVHAPPEVRSGRIEEGPEDTESAIMHFAYPDFADYMAKANRYTEGANRVFLDQSDPFDLFTRIHRYMEEAEKKARARAETPFEVSTYALRAFYDVVQLYKDWIYSLGPESRNPMEIYDKKRNECLLRMREFLEENGIGGSDGK